MYTGDMHCMCVDGDFESVTEETFRSAVPSKNTLFDLNKTFDRAPYDFPVDKIEKYRLEPGW